jgi:hypothetical protein
VQHVGLQFVIRDQIRRTVVVARQPINDADLTVARQRGQPAQFHLIDEALT